MTHHLNFDPSREPLPPDDELWGNDGLLHAGGAGESALSDITPFDEALDASLRTLAQAGYHVRDRHPGQTAATNDAPAAIPRDAMWAAISSRRTTHANEARASASADHAVRVHALTPRQSRRLWPTFAALAATLVIGVLIGRRVTEGGGAVQETPRVALDAPGGVHGDAPGLPVMLATLTSQHFASTEALLVTARQDMGSGTTDASVATWARDLLLSTRLLLDTDELRDLRTRQLLQDLELTLALIVQAQSSGRAADAQTVRDDLESGDLLLRVRGAAMPSVNSPNDIRGMSE